MDQVSQESARSSPIEDTTEVTVDLISKMSKYVFDRKGIKLARFDDFWKDFLTEFPEFSHAMDETDLRLTFVCNILPTPFGKNTLNLPEEEFYYLKLGDWDPDEQEDSVVGEELTVSDLLAIRSQPLHRGRFNHESLQKFAKVLRAGLDLDDVDVPQDSADSDDSTMDFSD